MKGNYKGKVLAIVLTAIMVIGVLPINSFAVETPSQKVVSINTDGLETSISVPEGTEKDDLGLPSKMEVRVEKEAASADAADKTVKTEVKIKWTGDYKADQVGTYKLKAAFVNDRYIYSEEMPSVSVKVNKAEQKLKANNVAPLNTGDSKNGDYINLIDINAITSALFEVKAQGESNFQELPLPEGTVLHVGDEVHIKFHYSQLDNVQADNIYYFDIPKGLSALTGQSRGDIKSDDNQVIGSYWVENDKVMMQFTNEDYLRDNENVITEGFVNFYATLNQDAVTQQGEITLGGIVIGKVPIVPDEEIASVKVKKWNGTEATGATGLVYDPNRNAVQYTIQIDTTGNNKTIDKIDVTDTLITSVNGSEDPSVVTGDYTDINITPSTAGVTFTKGAGGKYVLHAENVAPNKTITVTYWVPVKPGIVQAKFVNDIEATKTVDGKTSPAGDASVQGVINNTLIVNKKSASPQFNTTDGKTTVSYTVTVEAPSTNTTDIADAYIDDVFTFGGDLVKRVVSVESSNTAVSSDCVIKTINGKPGFTVNLGTVKPNDKITFTYVVELDSEKCYFGDVPSGRWLDNWAYAKSGDMTFDSSKASHYFERENTKKDGTYDSAQGLFRYTVTFNGMIPGKTDVNSSDSYYNDVLKNFTDVITTNGYVFVGTPAPVIEAFRGDNVIKTAEIDGSIVDGKQKATIAIPDSIKGQYSYRLTYYVIKTGAASQESVTNNVSALTEGVLGEGVSHTFHSESTSSATQSASNAITKKLDGYIEGNGRDDYSEQGYKIEITSPVAQGAILTDWVTQNSACLVDVTFPIDYLRGNLALKLGNTALQEGKDYTLESTGDDSFKITFSKSFTNISDTNKLVITYKGKIAANEKGKEVAAKPNGINQYGNDKTITNNVEFNNNGITVTKKADLTPTADAVKKAVDTSAMEGVTPSDIAWDIILSSSGSYDMFGKGYHTLVDTLPDNLEIVKVESLDDNNTPTAVPKDTAVGNRPDYYTVSEDGRTVTIENAYSGHINHPGKYRIWTKVKDSMEPDNFQNKIFSNSAYYEASGAKWTVSADTSVTRERNKKTYTYTGGTENQGGVKFTLIINEYGEDIDPLKNTLTIHDTMNRQLSLDKDSLLINGKPIGQIEGASLTYQEGSSKFDLVIPDGMKCEITYIANIDAEVGEAGWLENTATIESRIGTITTSDLETKRLDLSAGSTSMYSFYIKKTDEGGKLLKGAKFLLNKVTLENGQLKETPMTTAANQDGVSLDLGDGTYKYRGVKKTVNSFNCVYSLQETDAPAGCIKDPKVHYIAFGDNVNPALKAALDAEGKTIEAAHTGQGANLDTMFNLKNNDAKINIPVRKVWDDSSNLDGLRPGTVKIKLMDGEEVVKAQDITGDGNTWNYTFENLPTHKTLADGSRKKIEYSIEEDQVAGYEAPIISGGEENGYIVTNKHDVPEGVTEVFGGSKTLTEGGQKKDITEGQFKFTVSEAEGNPAKIGGLPQGEISVGADGKFSLGSLSFIKAGTYTFTVSEVNGGAAGYSYDAKAVKVTVPVTLDQDTNKLKIGTVSYEKGGEPAQEIAFANTYTTPEGASQGFSGKKTLTEGGNAKDITAGQFKFNVSESESNPAKIGGIPNSAVEVGADGSIGLGDLTFPKAGEYAFTVSEVNSGAAGYSYDDKAVTVTVPVTLDKDTNKLKIGTVVYKKGGADATGIKFENTYTAPTGTELQFTGKKTLTEGGQNKEITAGQFKFTAQEGGNNPAAIGGFPQDEISVGADGNFSLGKLSFSKAGEYTFTVSEKNGGAAGYSYDDKAVTVTVPVTLDKGTNELKIGTVSYNKGGNNVNGIAFENTYTTPEGANQVFNGKKTLTEGDQNKEITAGQFKFTVSEAESNPAKITGLPQEEISIGADGSFSLGTLSFTKAGEYTFTVSEVNSGAAGYSYDGKAVIVTVPVTLDQDTNELKIGTVSYNKDGNDVNGIAFANTYTTPEATEKPFAGKKELFENEEAKAITAGQFKFVVQEGESNPAKITGLPQGEISVGADGSFELGALGFPKAGKYTFTVSEVNSGAAGYSYDDKAVTVTVPVSLDENTNKLVIGDVEYSKDGQEAAQGISFKNGYTTPASVNMEFAGNKTLTENGQKKEMTAGQFKFTVSEDGGNPAKIEGLPNGEISVGTDGSFNLGALVFPKAGDYTFTVSEVNGGAAGYSYDSKDVTVTVPVRLNTATNELEIGEVSYKKAGDDAEGIAFANEYTSPDPAETAFSGKKLLMENGRKKIVKNGQFKFIVKEAPANPEKIEGLPEGEVTTGLGGNINFGNMKFSKAGTYIFTVSEKNEGVKNYTYDDKDVTVTAQVVLNTDTNKLEVQQISYQKGGKDVEGIMFENTYTPPSGEKSAKTGDDTNMLMLLMLSLLSLAGIVSILAARRRKQNRTA